MILSWIELIHWLNASTYKIDVLYCVHPLPFPFIFLLNTAESTRFDWMNVNTARMKVLKHGQRVLINYFILYNGFWVVKSVVMNELSYRFLSNSRLNFLFKHKICGGRRMTNIVGPSSKNVWKSAYNINHCDRYWRFLKFCYYL